MYANVWKNWDPKATGSIEDKYSSSKATVIFPKMLWHSNQIQVFQQIRQVAALRHSGGSRFIFTSCAGFEEKLQPGYILRLHGGSPLTCIAKLGGYRLNEAEVGSQQKLCCICK